MNDSFMALLARVPGLVFFPAGVLSKRVEPKMKFAGEKCLQGGVLCVFEKSVQGVVFACVCVRERVCVFLGRFFHSSKKWHCKQKLGPRPIATVFVSTWGSLVGVAGHK
jgi:hypothetical protein